MFDERHHDLFFQDGSRCILNVVGTNFWAGFFEWPPRGVHGYTDKASKSTFGYAFFRAGLDVGRIQRAAPITADEAKVIRALMRTGEIHRCSRAVAETLSWKDVRLQHERGLHEQPFWSWLTAADKQRAAELLVTFEAEKKRDGR